MKPNQITHPILAAAGLAILIVTIPSLASDAETQTDAAVETVPIGSSRVIPLDQTTTNRGPWGEFKIHLRGQTAMTHRAFAGICTVRPGMSVHPEHRHAEEEYLVIMEGEGVWSVAGKETPAKKGDVLYVEPWVFHGLRNTGDSDLVFFVVKYASKGLRLPPEPRGSHGS